MRSVSVDSPPIRSVTRASGRPSSRSACPARAVAPAGACRGGRRCQGDGDAFDIHVSWPLVRGGWNTSSSAWVSVASFDRVVVKEVGCREPMATGYWRSGSSGSTVRTNRRRPPSATTSRTGTVRSEVVSLTLPAKSRVILIGCEKRIASDGTSGTPIAPSEGSDSRKIGPNGSVRIPAAATNTAGSGRKRSGGTCSPRGPSPPSTSTVPSTSKVARWPMRAGDVPLTVKALSVTGSHISAGAPLFPLRSCPPTISTRPSLSVVAV